MDDLDVEIGFPVSEPFAGAGDIKASAIPSGKSVTCTFTGPYSAIEPAYKALQQFVIEKGLKTTGVAYEFYLNDPGETPPEELQTQIVFPLFA